ncbi:MAG TPA: shikimate dehydrogenase [Gemmatimonadaceae bacterium]|jgi:shikimate dehydrogenase|nr:shikimate dehydrogenase [Gemmatimonadaceae bacterium]
MRRPPERLVLLGHPVAHSRSPQMHNAALAAAGISARYEALDVAPERFHSTVVDLAREGAAGNVTIPHKERMYAACSTLSPIARRVGAVNTWWVGDDGALSGDNTDVGGVDEAVRRLFDDAAIPPNLKVGVLGAGGSAAAVVAAAESWPSATVRIYNRTGARARALCERFGAFAQPIDDARALSDADLLVNATSIGMRDEAAPFDVAALHDGARVFDLVYRRGETRLVRAAHARGLAAADGLAMLVEQAALAFERWFGVAPDRATMRRAAESG